MADVAKKHKVLQDLKREVQIGFIDQEFVVRGRKFKLKTLNEEEETWSDQFVQTGGTPYAMIVSSRSPKLAVSITHIDDVPVSDLFEYPEEWSKEQRADLDTNPLRKKFWLRTQMMQFLANDLDREFILELFKAFKELDDRRSEVIKQVPN